MEVADYLVISMFVTFIGLMFTGFPISWVLGGTAVIFTLVGMLADQYLSAFTGINYLVFSMNINRIYRLMYNWVLVALPMFIFMGLMLDRSGIAEKLMKSMQNLFGKVHGGLAVTVCLIGVILAASTGIVGASVVLLGLLTIPAMMDQGYSKTFAVGTVAGSGTLGILIPPSIMLVIMADQMALSVGDLFMGAVFPGLILGFLYIAYILIYGLIKPDKVPLDPERKPLQWRMLWDIVRDILPAALLILAVLGSIFAGITTPTEASGVGALGAILLAAANRKFNWTVLKEVTKACYNTTAYIYGILIGATAFALVLRSLGGDEFIEKILTSLPFGPYGVMFFILFCVFFLGFFLDWIEITLIVLPLVAPVVQNLGLSINGYGVVDNPTLVWFVILIAVTLQTSFLSPPVGFALFYLKGICPPEVTLGDIYKGVIPFIILQLIGLGLIIIWPQLVLWLPAVAYR
ncbi:MAG: TRAP transporter large permease subunit [Pseudomonadota bacterium]|nr:TRAP transporter large permease subunit [Pseudomonadota bacterium]